MKNVLIFSVILFLAACSDTVYHEDPDVTEEVMKLHKEKLVNAKVKFLKCYPGKDGKMKAVYTTIMRDNSFPATIRFDYINKGYNMYFDRAYLNRSKKDFLEDVNECIIEMEKLKEARKSWK